MADKVEIPPELGDILARGLDIVVWSEEVLGVLLNPAQKRWLRYAASITEGWRWRYHKVIHVAANQIGKTLGLAILITWALFYKIGLDPDDTTAWAKRPYRWFHLGPTQQQAYLCLAEMRQLIGGSHKAQGDRCKLPAVFFSEERLANYEGIVCDISGAQCQFRTTDDKAQALQGVVANGISLDEAAFEDHLKIVLAETLEMRLISTGGPLLMVSTPNGMNDYFDEVETVQKGGRQIEERVWVKGRSVVTWSVISDNVGFGITQTAVDEMEAGLPESTKEQQLRGAFLSPSEAFFVPTDAVLASFKAKLPTSQDPQPGHRYVIFWDLAVGNDPVAAIVLDVTQKPWIGVLFRYYPKPPGVFEMVAEMRRLHMDYNGAKDVRRVLPDSVAITGYDATGMGGVMTRQMLYGLTPSKGLNFGGPGAKLDFLTNARAALTKRPSDLILPDSWVRVRQEVVNYRLKDDKLQQDACMALVGAIEIAARHASVTRSIAVNHHARISPTWR
jgi:hypothetical protein